jgi:hypothetical protein
MSTPFTLYGGFGNNPFTSLLKWILDTERGGGGESVSQNFGKFSTFHKLTEQQIFISFSQSIYIK